MAGDNNQETSQEVKQISKTPSLILREEIFERSDVKTDKRTNESWEGSPMEHIKSQEINPVVRTVEGNPMGRIKLQESNLVVRILGYAKILRRNILPSYSIDAQNYKKSRLITCYLCVPKSIFLSVLSLCDSPGGGASIQNIYKIYDEQAGDLEGGKSSRYKTFSCNKMNWRLWPGTATYTKPIKFEGQCEDLKSFIFNCS